MMVHFCFLPTYLQISVSLCLNKNGPFRRKQQMSSLIHIFRSSHRDDFLEYLFFFSKSNVHTIFPRNLCHHKCFSRKTYYMFFEQGTNFPGGFVEQRCFFKEGLSVRRTDIVISSNRN